MADGRVEALTGDGLEPTAVLWSAANDVLVLAETTGTRPNQGGARGHWWLVAADSQPRKLTGELGAVPHRLVREKGRDAFVGFAGGDAVRLSIEGLRCESLTADLEARIAWVVWPSADTSDEDSFRELIVAVVGGASPQWHRLELDTGQPSPLSSPAPGESRLHFSPRARSTTPASGARRSRTASLVGSLCDRHVGASRRRDPIGH